MMICLASLKWLTCIMLRAMKVMIYRLLRNQNAKTEFILLMSRSWKCIKVGSKMRVMKMVVNWRSSYWKKSKKILITPIIESRHSTLITLTKINMPILSFNQLKSRIFPEPSLLVMKPHSNSWRKLIVSTKKVYLLTRSIMREQQWP